ncbi:MAG: Fic family protein [Candidatus Gracilibacteria bacterium]|nr:Fic family protein [Candidatus Gracilibacteria bacterium]
MYIENKGSAQYLVKKVSGKKIAVNISHVTAPSVVSIEELSRKEFEFLSNQQRYKEFKNDLYNPEILDEVFSESIFLSNIINNHLLPNDVLNQKYQAFAIRFIYESNKTEGSRIPLEAVEQIIQQKKYVYKIKNEIIEVENSLRAWEFVNKKFIFNRANIKKLYHILTTGLLQESGQKYPRGFKKVPIVVNNTTTTSPENVDREVESLLQDYKIHTKVTNQLKQAFDFHLRFEQIHPFENGNGRTGRFLLNKILLANGLLPMIVFEANRQSYFNAIHSALSGNKKKYYTFMLEQYQKTLSEYWKR